MKSSILVLGAAAAAMAVPTPHSYAVHERREYIPNTWVEEKRLDGATSLPVRIGLTQSNLEHGHDLLMALFVPFNLVFL